MIKFIFFFGLGVAFVNLFGLFFMSPDYVTSLFHLLYLIIGIIISVICYRYL
jgi:hypothetical protein